MMKQLMSSRILFFTLGQLQYRPFLIGIHSMQGCAAAMTHKVPRKFQEKEA